ncbi:hypothetical protein WKH31_10510 [Metabacillus indicus]|uniref:hypothetical protein n=1 Tax=Metabacillus indicus TaxID=246786 RepID=UPI003178BF03
MSSNEVTLKAKTDIDVQTYNILSKYLGEGQVKSLNNKAVSLQNVEVINKFYYSMSVKDTRDHSDVEFTFNVYKLKNELFILYVKTDIKFSFEVKETIQEVREKHTWFIEHIIDFHRDVLISKRN